MQIILVSRRNSGSKTINLSKTTLFGSSVLAVAAIAVSAVLLTKAIEMPQQQSELITEWQGTLRAQQEQLVATKQENQAKIEALAVKTAQLQSRLLRLDALAERMATMAKLDKSEFDFSERPAMGGPEESGDELFDEMPDFHKSLDQLADQIILKRLI